MSLQKELIKEGDGKTYPKKGDNVTMEFVMPLPCTQQHLLTDLQIHRLALRVGKGEEPWQAVGYLQSLTPKLFSSASRFDSSVGRGDFKTAIGVGRVIAGWDEGVPQMSLGERSVLTIPGKMAYGDRGFPGLIPPNATLIFEVELKGIN
jgi:FK506-binding protein 1